jgi:hypothetical protein
VRSVAGRMSENTGVGPLQCEMARAVSAAARVGVPACLLSSAGDCTEIRQPGCRRKLTGDPARSAETSGGRRLDTPTGTARTALILDLSGRWRRRRQASYRLCLSRSTCHALLVTLRYRNRAIRERCPHRSAG